MAVSIEQIGDLVVEWRVYELHRGKADEGRSF